MHGSSTIDSQYNDGRKGLAYDWQSLFVAAHADTLEAELAALDPLFTAYERA